MIDRLILRSLVFIFLLAQRPIRPLVERLGPFTTAVLLMLGGTIGVALAGGSFPWLALWMGYMVLAFIGFMGVIEGR